MSFENFLAQIGWKVIFETGPSLITAIASVSIAITACRGLDTWKEQEKAKVHILFVDELVTTVHQYIDVLNDVISALEFYYLSVKEKDSCNSIVEDIRKNEGRVGKRILNELNIRYDIYSKMISLAMKGQALNFKEYNKCFLACHALKDRYCQIIGSAQILSDPFLNWEKEVVEKTVNLDLQEIKNNINSQNKSILEFADKVYKEIF